MSEINSRPTTGSGLLRSISGSVRGIDSSHQLALGIAFGAVVGLLPKDNLLFAAVLVLMILSGNLLTGSLTAIGVSLLGPMIEPACHTVGKSILSIDRIQAFLTWLFQLPMGAWTRLDNTVVVGSFAISILIFLPTYLVSHYFFSRYRKALDQMLNRGRIVNWFIGYTPQET